MSYLNYNSRKVLRLKEHLLISNFNFFSWLGRVTSNELSYANVFKVKIIIGISVSFGCADI